MIKHLLSICLLIIITYSVNAQVHFKGVKGAEITVAKTGKGFGFSAAYSKFISTKFYYKIGAFYENATIQDVSSDLEVKNGNYLFDLKCVYTPINLGNSRFFIGPFLGFSGGLENISKTSISKANSEFIYGPTIGAESEFYIRDNFAVIFNFTQRYYPTSEIGTLRYNFSSGFKLTF